jgi:precorrin-6B methylase 1
LGRHHTSPLQVTLLKYSRRTTGTTASLRRDQTAPARGSLTVVGTGIKAAAHLTTEARLAIEGAEQVLYAVTDPIAAAWIQRANPNARSLDSFYEPGKQRRQIYAAISDEIVSRVHRGTDVCAVFYGHPGVFAWAGHDAIRRLRGDGLAARMLPGVSSMDCLVADLGLDPAPSGCQSYEATDFLVRRRTIDTGALLILWQIGFIGAWDYEPVPSLRALPLLVERLRELYPPDHETLLYEASPYPVCEPLVERLSLASVSHADVSPIATMVLLPSEEPEFDREMLDRVRRLRS